MGHIYTPGSAESMAEALEETSKALKAGGVAVFPTDTVYGIGVLVSSYQAGPEPLFRIKRRPREKKIPLLLPSMESLHIYGSQVDVRAEALARAFWPGGLTLVVRASDAVPLPYRNENGTVAVRVPGPSFALDLLGALGEAMAVTSANSSGLPSPTCGKRVEGVIVEQVDIVIDAGQTRCGEASTIVDCTQCRPNILRQGAVSANEILSVWEGGE